MQVTEGGSTVVFDAKSSAYGKYELKLPLLNEVDEEVRGASMRRPLPPYARDAATPGA